MLPVCTQTGTPLKREKRPGTTTSVIATAVGEAAVVQKDELSAEEQEQHEDRKRSRREEIMTRTHSPSGEGECGQAEDVRMSAEDSDNGSNGSVVTQASPEQLPIALADIFLSSNPCMKDIFLDYDGTLREFELTPELAVPTQELRTLLQKLNDRDDLRIAFVSGRPMDFLFEHFSHLDKITLVAEHGQHILRRSPKKFHLEIESSTQQSTELDYRGKWETFVSSSLEKSGVDTSEWKPVLKECLAKCVERTPDSFLEEKISSLVWHYRKCPHVDEAAVLQLVVDLENCLRENSLDIFLRVQRGNKIVEVSGSEVTKGNAVRKLQAEWRNEMSGDLLTSSTASPPPTLCAGDDVSDEDMFGSAVDAINIKVGAGSTSARYYVDTPSDLRYFLSKII